MWYATCNFTQHWNAETVLLHKVGSLTLKRSIGLPPDTPVAQKIADQRWHIANSAKISTFLYKMMWLVFIRLVSVNKHLFFSSISLIRISYKSIWLKICSWYKLNEKWNLEGLKLVFSKRCASKIWWEVSEVRFKKTRLLHLGNVEKPPHPQFSVQRAPEG